MLKYLTNSKKGLRRDRNQDRVLIAEQPGYYLFLIFDGVSSHPRSYAFINQYKKILRSKLSGVLSDGNNLEELLFESHKEVLASGCYGMSTVSGLFYSKIEGLAKFVNIGDSRVYIFSNQFIEKITSDDSMENRPNILTKCLGSSELSLEDFKLKEVNTDYNFLICTDGFYSLMSSNLKEYFSTYNFKKLKNIEKKLSYLQRRKNNDDSSYILIKHEIPS
ncbi:PP2C family protein-serine/threonine phosphatase [Arcticibacter eurypsychrophilus]|uniref:PP2C family protein-serine/threonine phosphatase n=1 Tax=Arcticibacter eurypsychrophilus TaxID=1434752 RepID=UPI00084D1554|nr:protein phosphatase 2C domain-containing protein [Arcticibacter eurypsychrophilus]